ncbi:Na(+)/H(+) antiporter subunit C [Streptomyces sp. 7-21]|uniref:Na(+)/H(+) antiporter subunit C n=1 Tax=Streptomyces sp. 7-21 TaxID=2802283 RepID=UPI00191CD9AC|nr:Na(+)/H(+) antiporter subunit C [Streptomyces sp. 7-21]MBL1065177.1 Na(+)/H(+) antiporter subunit C [Streptomyces sp. 7-21]
MTTLNLVMALAIGGLFAAGTHLLLQRSLTRALLGVILLGHATNLLLLAGAGPPGRAPVLGGYAGGRGEPLADPLPQAMALTAIVITFGLTAFLLSLAYRSWRLTGHDEVRDDLEDRLIGSVAEREEEHIE